MNESLVKKNSEYRIQNTESTTGPHRWPAIVEGELEAGEITLTPQSDVDRGIAESLADFAAGRSFGPFRTDRELIKLAGSGECKSSFESED
jgi:hypothetical protein